MIVASKRRERGDEGLLGNVECLVRIADGCPYQTKYRFTVARQQFAIGVLPTSERQCGQFAVAPL